MHIAILLSIMSESLTQTPTTSDLADPNTKTLFEHYLEMHCKWKTCLAISEMKIMPKQEKLALLLTTWLQIVNSLKANESAIFMRCELPTSADWDIICALLLTSVTSGQTVHYRFLLL